MKSDMDDGKYYIECGCENPEHLLCFWFNSSETKPEWMVIDVSFTAQHPNTFWIRVKQAFKYIFKNYEFLRTSDSILINKKNIAALKEAVEAIELEAKNKKLI